MYLFRRKEKIFFLFWVLKGIEVYKKYINKDKGGSEKIKFWKFMFYRFFFYELKSKGFVKVRYVRNEIRWEM